jgi:hypothetical protein
MVTVLVHRLVVLLFPLYRIWLYFVTLIVNYSEHRQIGLFKLVMESETFGKKVTDSIFILGLPIILQPNFFYLLD